MCRNEEKKMNVLMRHLACLHFVVDLFADVMQQYQLAIPVTSDSIFRD
jgi:hypothetical protein